MIIQRLTLSNFRPFYGLHLIDFSESEETNVTLIHAENGVGKSAILSSILWCLYERVIEGFSQPGDLLNHEARDEGETEFSVELEFEHDGKEYSVERRGHSKIIGAYTSTARAFAIDGGNRIPITNTFNFINSVVPSTMADYFFFHGEGNIAEKGKNIRQAIRDILGFSLAETAIDDLKSIETSIRSEMRKISKDKDLQAIQSKLIQHSASLEETQGEYRELEPLSNVHDMKISQLERQLRDQPDVRDIQVKRQDEQLRKKKYQTQYQSWVHQETNFISEFGWALMAEGIANESTDFIDDSEIKGKIPSPYNETFVQDLLSKKICICGNKLKPGTDAYNLVHAMLASSGNAELYNRIGKVRARIQGIKMAINKAPDEWKRVQENLQNNLDLVRNSEQKISELKAQIDNCNEQKVLDIENELHKYKGKQKETNKRIGLLTHQITIYMKEVKKLETDEKLAVARDKGLSKLQHKLEFVQHLVSTLSDELDGAEDKAVEKIMDGVNETLSTISRKAYTAEINKESNTLNLRKPDGKIVGDSSGERLLLNFAFICTLIEFCRQRQEDPDQILEAGAIAPFVIDAPFGELDDTYKAATAEFIPTKSRQVVFLLSSSHWSGVRDQLDPYIGQGSEYYLRSENRDGGKGKPLDLITINERSVEQSKYACERDMTRVMGVSW